MFAGELFVLFFLRKFQLSVKQDIVGFFCPLDEIIHSYPPLETSSSVTGILSPTFWFRTIGMELGVGPYVCIFKLLFLLS